MQQRLISFMIFAASPFGQIATAQLTPNLSFEVASIKPHPEPVTASYDPMVRGFTVVGAACSLRDMITVAYGVRYDQLAGGPN